MVTISFATLVSQPVSPLVNQSAASVGATFLQPWMKYRAGHNNSSRCIGNSLSWGL